MNNISPLVSVAVITYNSSETLIETLDSIAAQDYTNIELLISDDCSTDNTLEICEAWLKTNADRFFHSQIITVSNNTGVTANCQRAENACNSEWVKIIAGDDVLMPMAISSFVRYIQQYPDTVYVFSKVECFGASKQRCREVEQVIDYEFFNLHKSLQLERLICGMNCIPAASSFYSKKRVNELHIEYDTRIPMLEDWPRWINILNAGVNLRLIDDVLVKYRVSRDGALTNSIVMSKIMDKSMALFRIYYMAPGLWEFNRKNQAISEYCFGKKVLSETKIEWLFWAVCLKLCTLFRMN